LNLDEFVCERVLLYGLCFSMMEASRIWRREGVQKNGLVPVPRKGLQCFPKTLRHLAVWLDSKQFSFLWKQLEPSANIIT
jgi:hypothetical protein